MNKKEEKVNIICQRCKNNPIFFCCNSCPKPFDKLCFECDTYVHSIIPYKKLHIRNKINNSFDEIKINQEVNLTNEKNDKVYIELKELKEKCNLQFDIINKLHFENNLLKNNIMKLDKQNNYLKKEKEEYQKNLNYLKNELEKYKKENNDLRKDLNKNCNIINELNNNIKILNNNISKKEEEIVDLKIYFSNKINNTKEEKEALLKVLDDSNYKLIEKNDVSFHLKEENELLKKRVICFEQENIENLKLISDLHKENKELIHRINKLSQVNNIIDFSL